MNDLHNKKIMIVDDVLGYVRLIERVLQMNDYADIQTTTDARQVVDLFRNSQPDLLLLDLEMPNLHGLDILDMLRDERNGEMLPVIIITAQNNWDHKTKALELGAYSIIQKPFTNEELTTKIQEFFISIQEARKNQ